MNNILERLFLEHNIKMRGSRRFKELDRRIKNNRKLINAHMNKKEKEIILQILDAKDVLADEASYNSFVHGFKTGLKIGYEVNRE